MPEVTPMGGDYFAAGWFIGFLSCLLALHVGRVVARFIKHLADYWHGDEP